MPEVDRVEVVLENLVFGVAPLDPLSQDRFLHLALEGLLGGHERLLHVLLRDRGTALRLLAESDVGVQGACDAEWIDAGVLVEAPVFRRDDRLLQLLRHVGQGHILPILLGEELGEGLARSVVDHRRLVATARLGDIRVRQLRRHRLVHRASGDPDGDDEKRNNDEEGLDEPSEPAATGTAGAGSRPLARAFGAARPLSGLLGTRASRRTSAT